MGVTCFSISSRFSRKTVLSIVSRINFWNGKSFGHRQSTKISCPNIYPTIIGWQPRYRICLCWIVPDSCYTIWFCDYKITIICNILCPVHYYSMCNHIAWKCAVISIRINRNALVFIAQLQCHVFGESCRFLCLFRCRQCVLRIFQCLCNVRIFQLFPIISIAFIYKAVCVAIAIVVNVTDMLAHFGIVQPFIGRIIAQCRYWCSCPGIYIPIDLPLHTV